MRAAAVICVRSKLFGSHVITPELESINLELQSMASVLFRKKQNEAAAKTGSPVHKIGGAMQLGEVLDVEGAEV